MKRILFFMLVGYVNLQAAEKIRAVMDNDDNWTMVNGVSEDSNGRVVVDEKELPQMAVTTREEGLRKRNQQFIGSCNDELESVASSSQNEQEANQDLLRSASSDSLVDICVNLEELTKTAICSVAQKAETAYWFFVTLFEDLPQD